MTEVLPQYVNAKQLSQMLGIGLSTLERMRCKGILPTSIKVGRNRRWKLAAVQTWLDEVEAEGRIQTA